MVRDPAFVKIHRLWDIDELSEEKIATFRKKIADNLVPGRRQEVKRVEELDIITPEGSVRSRLYVPHIPTEELIIFLHGGGWVFGDTEMYDNVCRKATNDAGCKLLSVNYRLAPENKFPAAVNDAYHSYIWSRENCGFLQVDPNRIAIAGDSSGGNLAIAACEKCKDNGISMPRLQVLFYPILGVDRFSESLREYGEDGIFGEKSIRLFSKLYRSRPEDELDMYFSPILRKDFEGFPEAIIVTGEHDPLSAQGEMYLSKLYSSRVRAVGLRAKGMIHGFLNFVAIAPAADAIVTMIWSQAGKTLKSGKRE